MQICKKILTCICIFACLAPAAFSDVIEGYGIDYNRKDAYSVAKSKFALTNVKTAHDEFADMIEDSTSKDFVLLDTAIMLAEYGFFDLTDRIFSKIDDYSISQNYIEDIRHFYYPAKRMGVKDLLFLAEAYSNIMYNNYAQEAVLDVVNNTELIKERNDYVFYILALGYYEIKDIDQAENYISIALSLNPNNVNYKILKTKILLERKNKKHAIKLFEEIKKENFKIVEFQNKISALEHYVLYKTEKNDKLKDYHLGYYYFLEGKTTFAQKVLLNALSNNKKINKDIYALLGLSYLSSSDKQAKENAQKSLKCGGESFNALYTMGIIELRNEHYKQGLKLLNKARKYEKDTYNAERLIALIYRYTGKTKASIKLWNKLVKKVPEIFEGYYYLAIDTDNDTEELLKKSLSYNVNFPYAYYKLGEIYINRENFELAKKYLYNAHYIDENDFRYYYYLSQLELQQGNKEQADSYLNSCVRMEPNYRDILDREKGLEK